MNPLLEAFLERGLLWDSLGILGLAVLTLAATSLACRQRSWGGSLMAGGALCLLLARLYLLTAPQLITNEVLHAIGPIGIAATIALPPLLLSFGLGGVVWGLWGHERWLRESGN